MCKCNTPTCRNPEPTTVTATAVQGSTQETAAPPITATSSHLACGHAHTPAGSMHPSEQPIEQLAHTQAQVQEQGEQTNNSSWRPQSRPWVSLLGGGFNILKLPALLGTARIHLSVRQYALLLRWLHSTARHLVDWDPLRRAINHLLDHDSAPPADTVRPASAGSLNLSVLWLTASSKLCSTGLHPRPLPGGSRYAILLHYIIRIVL